MDAAIERASRASYVTYEIELGMSTKSLDEYFVPVGDGYRVPSVSLPSEFGDGSVLSPDRISEIDSVTHC